MVALNLSTTSLSNTYLLTALSTASRIPIHMPKMGRAEHKHHHVIETGFTLLFHAHAASLLCVEAFSMVVYIINWFPTRTLQGQPLFSMHYGMSPYYTRFHTFRCLCYLYLCHYAPHKLAPMSTTCVFVGFNSMHKDFCCFDCQTQCVLFHIMLFLMNLTSLLQVLLRFPLTS